MIESKLAGLGFQAAGAGGGFALVILLGRWLLNWMTGRVERREGRLDQQQERIDREWQAIREELEGRITSLEERVHRAEGDLADERRRCDDKLAKYEAEVRVERHRSNNQRMMIHSLLHLFDIPAARRKEALANIRGELAAMEHAEATEKGILVAAPITAMAVAE